MIKKLLAVKLEQHVVAGPLGMGAPLQLSPVTTAISTTIINAMDKQEIFSLKRTPLQPFDGFSFQFEGLKWTAQCKNKAAARLLNATLEVDGVIVREGLLVGETALVAFFEINHLFDMHTISHEHRGFKLNFLKDDLSDDAVLADGFWSGDWRAEKISQKYNAYEQFCLKQFEWLPLPEHPKIIVPACGHGKLVSQVANQLNHKATLFAFDFNRHSIDAAAKDQSEHCLFEHGSVDNPETWAKSGWGENDVDLIIAGGLFTEPVLTHRIAEAGLEQVKKHLKPGGIFICYGIEEQRVNLEDFPLDQWTTVTTYAPELTAPFLITIKK
jgi:SAM-dependent methyltransferase